MMKYVQEGLYAARAADQRLLVGGSTKENVFLGGLSEATMLSTEADFAPNLKRMGLDPDTMLMVPVTVELRAAL